jgi:hypothetical protein
LSATAGPHRFVWDLHYAPVPGGGRGRYPMTAVYKDTPPEPTGPWAHPGQYTVRLTAGSTTLEQPLTIRMDPRVKTSAEGLKKQFELSMQCYEGIRQTRETLSHIKNLRSQIKELQAKAGADLAGALAELDKAAASIGGSAPGRGPGRLPAGRERSLSGVSQEMFQLLRVLQGADVAPTATAVAACEEVVKAHRDLQARWSELLEKDVKALNERLGKAGMPVLTAKVSAGTADSDRPK